MDILEIIILALCIVLIVIGIIIIKKLGERNVGNSDTDLTEISESIKTLNTKTDLMSSNIRADQGNLRSEISSSITNNVSRLGESLRDEQEKQRSTLDKSIGKIEEQFEKTRKETLETLEKIQTANAQGIKELREDNQKSLEKLEGQFEKTRNDTLHTLSNMQNANTASIDKLREDNQKSLDKINDTVNEKLQKTLNDRITQSFEIVNKRLGEVYEGLGEMKQVASGVTDLKKVLSNVKTRGVMGEIQLGAILSEILTTEQYGEQISVSGTREKVDYAVKLPGNKDGEAVWLPIDSKFPADTYGNLLDAYERGDSEEIKVRRKLLETEIKSFAKSISQKYIIPPYTTDFAVMFLPFEGLYSEVINLGLVEQLQRDYRINVAGPSTMAAMLNSLQMGFRTLAIQKKSSEVWTILRAAKTEFGKFEGVLKKVRDNLKSADNNLETLIGTRSNQIIRSLKNVEITADESNETETGVISELSGE